MTRDDIIIKASLEYALLKSKEKNTWFVDYKDIEEAFLEGAKWADETMIENACKWLIEQKEIIGISFQEDFIERFKMAIKK